MQRRSARHALLQLNGCAYVSSIAWHVMPGFISVTACNAAALGTSCLASTQWLHTWQQHNLARDALLQNQWPGLRISSPLVRGLKLHLRQPGLGWMRMRARLTYTHCWTDCRGSGLLDSIARRWQDLPFGGGRRRRIRRRRVGGQQPPSRGPDPGWPSWLDAVVSGSALQHTAPIRSGERLDQEAHVGSW